MSRRLLNTCLTWIRIHLPGVDKVQTLILILIFLYGTVFASFGNVVAYRLPRGESVVRPPSHCPACNHRLGAIDLVPIVSWLWLRGHCRHCAVDIPLRYPLFELIGGAICAATYLWSPNWPSCICWCVFWLFVLVLIEADLLYMRVPNRLSVPGAAVFFGLSMASGIQHPLTAAIGAAVNFLILFLLSVLTGGKMGMGDAKLYASIGAMLGPWNGILSLVLAAASGSVIGGAMRITGHLNKRDYMPFVPHIGVGVVLAVWFGHPLLTWYVHHVIGL